MSGSSSLEMIVFSIIRPVFVSKVKRHPSDSMLARSPSGEKAKSCSSMLRNATGANILLICTGFCARSLRLFLNCVLSVVNACDEEVLDSTYGLEAPTWEQVEYGMNDKGVVVR